VARIRLTVRQLATEAGISTDDALLSLWEYGIPVSSAGDYVPKKKLKPARRALGLPVELAKLTIDDLVKKYEVAEIEVRKVLRAKQVRVGEQGHIPNVVSKLAEALVREHTHTRRSTLQQVEAAATAQVKDLEKTQKTKADRRRKRDEASNAWRVIGRPEENLNFLTSAEVEEIHWVLVRDFSKSRDPIDPPGVRSKALLESAVFRPHTAMGEQLKYPSVVMAAAALFHAIIHDHCFHNGNKRTALVSLLSFLDKNGYVLTVSEEDLFDYVLDVSRHGLLNEPPGPGREYADREMMEVASWLQRHIKRVKKGEFCIKFRELREILSSYGCSFDPSHKSFINITRNGRKSQVWYGGEARDVATNTIHKIRSDLELDEAHGYDSDIFYNQGQKIADFIIRYRKTLNRLAKL
jgi:death-on-curing family protein